MDACGCDGFASIFDRRNAEHDRERYLKFGPDRTTSMLLEMIRSRGVEGRTIVDIGAGIGIIDRELLRDGAAHAVLVDGSRAYLDVARDVAREANLLDRVEIVEGAFTTRADEVDPADIVTLDRVVCCYPDADALVGLSAARARRLYGLVLPRNRWFAPLAIRLLNLGFAVRRSGYRAYAHSNARVDATVADAGLHLAEERTTQFWRVVLYERKSTASS